MLILVPKSTNCCASYFTCHCFFLIPFQCNFLIHFQCNFSPFCNLTNMQVSTFKNLSTTLFLFFTQLFEFLNKSLSTLLQQNRSCFYLLNFIYHCNYAYKNAKLQNKCRFLHTNTIHIHNLLQFSRAVSSFMFISCIEFTFLSSLLSITTVISYYFYEFGS